MFRRNLASLLLFSLILAAGCSTQSNNTNKNDNESNYIQIEESADNTESIEYVDDTTDKIEIRSVDIIDNTQDVSTEANQVSANTIELTETDIEEMDIEETDEETDIEETAEDEVSDNLSVVVEDTIEKDSIEITEGTLAETPEEVATPYTFPFDSTRDLSKPFLNNEPGKLFILDVDMNTDVDDVCAVRMATALDDLGVIDLKAVCYCTDYSSYGALRGILHHDMKDDVLMGQGTEDRHEGSPYWNELGKHNDFGGNWESSVRQYRKVLAEATSPVDIVTTGQVTNLEALLKSGPDDISPLTGKELVMTKVGQLYITGGDYPDGWSNNLALTNAATIATKYVSQNWGLPIIWSPGNHSGKLTCGKYLQDLDVYRQDPVTRALDAWGVSAGRAAWDPFAVWVGGYACAETNQVSLTQCSFGIQDGGANWFKEDTNGDDWVLNLTNTDLNYYNQTLDNHLIHIFSKVYGVENPNKEPIGIK